MTKFLWIITISGVICLSSNKSGLNSDTIANQEQNEQISNQSNRNKSFPREKIISAIQTLVSRKDTTGLLNLGDSLQKSLASVIPDSSRMAESYYYIGICNILAAKYNNALFNLKKSVEIKRRLKIIDDQFTKGIYNIGIAYSYLGDDINVINYLNEYLRIATPIYGENNPEIAEIFTALISASIECNDYEKFIEYTFKALGILSNNNKALEGYALSNLYSAIGAGYARMGDYAKARIYLEKAESILKADNIQPGEDYINLINSLAITYGSLGFTDKENEYFNKGIHLANYNNSYLSFNLINTYSNELGKSGKIQKGEILLSDMIRKAYTVYSPDSRYYIEELANYSDYLLKYKNDIVNSIAFYSTCLEYLKKHKNDVMLKEHVMISYAQALYKKGESVRALELIQELLFHNSTMSASANLYKNPAIDSLRADKESLRILRLKYEILWSLYSGSSDQKVLEAAAGTSEFIISLIDKMRINISEEESRIVLGDRYRDSYLLAIRDFELCYRNTGNRQFLEKAFEFSEKSKVAGLLAATRELNAVQFHVPESVAQKEKYLQREIGFYNSKISMENDKEKPDKTILSDWNEKLLAAIKARDSLVLTFEKDYPGYFALKYNTRTLEMQEVPSIIGRDCNYLNYVLSDSLLYIFLINWKYQKLLTIKNDSNFVKKLSDFRMLLVNPAQSENARIKFDNYQQMGYDLYRTLIEPVCKYFISDNLLISPDNILSYLPFETFISSRYDGNDILYRKLNYMMNDYTIAYAYSVTFMKEIVSREYNNKKNLIAFAPVYTKAITIDSLFTSRQQGTGVFNDLPYARQEAEYVSKITGGNLYLNDEARETVFKTEASKYNIIHLAMHTYLNDQNPMNSAMIFAQGGNAPEDGLLYTYEVYGIPLKARMVVLSSCNTGSGQLSSGEGILSLARGFLYSGSQSVVMSMWEIDDKSGTEIIKMFYDNLKKGKSKGEALKKARTEYLKKASQLKSHPYFWSSIVVYGENDPVFSSRRTLILSICSLIVISIALVYYFWKRKYS
jgi:CHAT domain-containing protein